MTEKDNKPTAPTDGEQAGKASYWQALVAEGFVPARRPKRMIVREGHPEVPLTRPDKRVKE
ncbi:hypothetical protein [Allomesorhizobium camelthorni]|uniref:Uncharacterized protein n=1 Tax=Allomesorhizobium camelthorni TaxID=475069 RepID=A0A6G4WIH5_9HYPH|nr:hypothetical protein [Mesorhizobium camelthorni]NGO54561.1 hypothetical protein [Mesorhizobium camelthorni]